MDDEHLPPLGPGKPWMVKDFPVTLREQINKAAAAQGVTVGRWLVAHFERHGIDGIEVNRVYPDTINTGNPPSPASASVEEACRIAEATAKLAEASGDKKPRAAINAAAKLMRQQAEARTTADAPSTRKALTPPSARTALPAPDGEAGETPHDPSRA